MACGSIGFSSVTAIYLAVSNLVISAVVSVSNFAALDTFLYAEYCVKGTFLSKNDLEVSRILENTSKQTTHFAMP